MLTDIWVRDADLGIMTAREPWVGDGVTGSEARVLTLLRNIASADAEIAKRAAASMLSAEGVAEQHVQSLERFFQTVVDQDVELARAISGYSWFADGLTPREWETIEMLVPPGRDHQQGMRRIARLPWVADGVTTREGESVTSLQQIVIYPALADRVFSYDWVTNETNYFEQHGLEYLGAIAKRDSVFAMTVAEKPWFVDGMTYHEQVAILYLSYIASRDLALAQGVADTIPGGLKNADPVIALGRLTVEYREEFEQFRDQPWVADGLDAEEEAFIVVLTDAASISRGLFADFLESRFTRSRTVTLPASGEIRLWAFQNTPFPSNDNTIETMEEAVRGIEELLGLPFITNDIIVSIVDQGVEETHEIHPAVHVGSHIRIARESNNPIPKSYIYHETGHYFFGFFPKWIIEGGPELLDSYIRDRMGVESIEDKLLVLEEQVERACYEQRIPNLLELNNREGFYLDESPLRCTYVFGEYFFLRLHQLLGEQALSAALREMHNRFTLTELDVRLRGKDIYQIFLNHTPPGKETEYRDLFRRLHGGPWPDANVNVADDHGDDAPAATLVQIGQVAPGVLAHAFDMDYFRFQAEGAQDYQIAVNHTSTEDIRLRLYAPDGTTLLAVRESEVEGAGLLYSWIAPSSGAYHIAVDSPIGSIDSYTLAVRPVVVGADDHGDEPSTATAISFQQVVHGVMDHRLDLDYFRFRVEAGLSYEATVVNDTLVGSRVRFYLSDGVTPVQTYAGRWGRDGSQRCAVASESGEHYAAVESPSGNSGAYRLEMTTTPCER